MHGSQGIMVDSHPISEGEAWLSTIIPMATVHQLFYIPLSIGHAMVPLHRNKPVYRNQFNFDSDKKRIIQLAVDCE